MSPLLIVMVSTGISDENDIHSNIPNHTIEFNCNFLILYVAIPVNISFANEAFSAVEGTGSVEVCFGTSGVNAEPFNVTVRTVMKEGVDSPATGKYDITV